jgi:drug/metabolite transporter (DMT)-like permease
MKNLRILSLFAFIVLSFGLGWPVSKIGLNYMSPAWYTTVRLLIAGSTMMMVVIAVGKFSWPKREDIPLILIIGLLQISIYILLASTGLAFLPAGRSSLLAYTTPLWIMPAVTFFFNEKAGILRWAGFFMGISGLIMLMSPWEVNWSDSRALIGAGILLLASLCWAISMLCARYMQWSKSPLELIPWQLLIGMIPILGYAFIKEPLTTVTWNTPLVLSLAYTGVLVTGLAYWACIIITRELPTIIVSLGFLMVPVVSLIISCFYMNEHVTITMLAAMALIIAGVGCVVAKE